MGAEINSMKMVDQCTNLFSVSKTLRFELKPVGKTQDFVVQDGILNTDVHRAESYQKVKKIMDRYHKLFIERSLAGLTLTGLEKYEAFYFLSSRDDKQEKEFQDIQASLRNQVAKCFTEQPDYKKMFAKEMLTEILPDFTKDNPEERALIEEFRNFSTYFTGFFQNRRNMYSNEPIATGIAYRIVHQNLPKFVENRKNFRLVKELEEDKILSLQENLREKIQIESVDECFELEGFMKVLTQSGIKNYNCIIGGYAEEGEIKVQGLNEYINLHNQRSEKNARKLPKMKELYKQILSDREGVSFVLEKFETDQEVLNAINSFYVELKEKILDNENEVNLEELISRLPEYDLDHVYITNDDSLSKISMYLFDDWGMLNRAIEDDYDRRNILAKKKKSAEKYTEIKEKELGKQTVYSIDSLNMMTETYLGERCFAERYFTEQISDKVENIRKAYDCCECLREEYPEEEKLCKDSESTRQIKVLLDAMKELQWLITPLLKGKEESDKEELFYVELIRINDTLSQLNSLYNKVRNYITKKPYSLEKVKLNFSKSTLLDGWDRNKEKDNLATIFLKDGNYYLGIMNRDSNQVMDTAPKASSNQVYQKMEYKLLPGPNKMLPKVFFSKTHIDEFAPDEELLKHYKEGTHKKGDNFNLEDCHKLIDFFKASIQKHSEWCEFDFHFSDTESYKDISGFYREVEQQGYKITFRDIDESYIDELVENGQLYLFKIYNKDFAEHSKGTPNLHTLYWRMLFSPENLAHPVYKLNGQAEIFYRKASIAKKDIVTHKPQEVLENKYPDAGKKTSTFKYELIKDRRFTVDKFQFHVPITMNFQAEGENYVNHKVRRLIHDAQNLHVIGIDRGERNLLYISVIDMNGNIIEQKSLNVVVSEGRKVEVDYHKILTKREGDNRKAKQNWQTVNSIKELKEGYLSQVVHEIAQMMIRYDAIVVLEDLNFGFKRSRQKVERQVYQKFEKMLIDKLNYLVDKGTNPNENGGLLHAYQLTEKFESFQKLGKQSGFLFYVPAWNTSKIDPATGFVNLFDTKYINKVKTQEFIEKFDVITYNQERKCFDFYFDYSKFTEKAEGSRTKWCICSEGNRAEAYRNPNKNNKTEFKTCDLTERFIQLFEQYQIDWKEKNLVQSLSIVEEAEFYRSFMHLLSLMLKLRNDIDGEDKIISPVRNESGECFETKFPGTGEEQNSKTEKQYPYDADANGAYNIAKKGLWIIEQIKKTPEDKLDKVKLAITNKEWLAYAQEHRI